MSTGGKGGGKKRPRADLLSTLDAAFASTAQSTDSKYTAQAAAQAVPQQHKQQAYQQLKRKRKDEAKRVTDGNGRRQKGRDRTAKESEAKRGKKQTEAAYEKMSTELLAIGLKDCSLQAQVPTTLTKPRVLHETLKNYLETVTHGTKADSSAVGSLKNKVLSLDNPFKKSAAAATVAKTIAAASRNQTAKLLSARQRRALGLHLLRGEIHYSHAEMLKEIWTRYVLQVIASDLSDVHHVSEEAQRTRNAKVHMKLKYLDLSGCPLEVVQAPNPCTVGLHGIVVAETRQTLQLCSPTPSTNNNNNNSNSHGSLRTVVKSSSRFKVRLSATRTLFLDSAWFADRAAVANQ